MVFGRMLPRACPHASIMPVAPVAYQVIILEPVLSFIYRLYIDYISSGGWGKVKLKLTTLPRISIRVVCRFNSIAFATQR